MSKTTLPKGVWFQRKVLASGEVVRYGYFGRGAGAVALGKEGSPEFFTNIAAAVARIPNEKTVAYLIHRYQTSREFAKLRPRTQSDYRRQLGKVQDKFGKLPIATMALPQISDRIFTWRDRMAESSPRQADYAVSVLAAMLSWSVTRGLIPINRAAGVGDVYSGDRRDKVWTPEMEEALHRVAAAPVRLAAILAIDTGASQEDLLVMPKSARQGNVIVGRRLKNGTPFAVPVSPRLAAALDAAPQTDSLTMLNKADGRPWEPKGNGLRSLFREACEVAGITGRTFHDQRGTFITRRRAMGWTAEEVALCSGHKVHGEAGAQGGYVDRMQVAIANAERLWARYYGPEAEQKAQTACQTEPGEDGVSV